MRKKHIMILALILALSLALPGCTAKSETQPPAATAEVTQSINAAETANAVEQRADTEAYIDLQGEWHFKVYRKYENMYQYFNYGGCAVIWEDSTAAAVPSEETYSQWETVLCPADDYSTGGLLQMYRSGTDDDVRNTLTENELFPKWSEAWFCKTVELPAGFTTEDTVTLLLGVIDDIDVVYINGVPVAQSGFITADGQHAPAANVPEDGGFEPEGDFRFEKSYWEVTREYTIDSSLLNEGKNELCIRIYNNNSFGGFYDRTMALVATRECVNTLKGLPVDPVSEPSEFESVVAAQIASIEAEDLDAYAATLSDDFVENELDKEAEMAKWQDIFNNYDNITVSDKDGGIYSYNGATVYFAARTVTGTKDGESTVILSDPEFLQYLTLSDTGALEIGNHSRCYSVTYTSALEEMNGKQLQYSIYLPQSYYENTDKAYPVVYLLHGINSTGDSFVNVDGIETFMDNLISSGEIQEMIVVMPNSGKSSFYEDTDAPDGVSDSAGPWAKHIYIDILEQIDSNYRTIPEKEFRGMSGISMGGGGVFKVGVTHTDIYSSFASHMGAVAGAKEYIDTVPADILPTLDFYLDCGNQDQMVSPDATREIGEYLESLGANVHWELRDGAHNSAFYMAGMPASMKMHSDHFVANGLLELWGEK